MFNIGAIVYNQNSRSSADYSKILSQKLRINAYAHSEIETDDNIGIIFVTNGDKKQNEISLSTIVKKHRVCAIVVVAVENGWDTSTISKVCNAPVFVIPHGKSRDEQSESEAATTEDLINALRKLKKLETSNDKIKDYDKKINNIISSGNYPDATLTNPIVEWYESEKEKVHIYLIGGAMGTGKTSCANQLKRFLYNSVVIEGDNLWNSQSVTFNDVHKKLVLKNIHSIINNCIETKAYTNVIFTWVMHTEAIIKDILSGLKLDEHCTVKIFTLTASKDVLKQRLTLDIGNGKRSNDGIIIRAYDRLEKAKSIPSNLSVKIDTSKMSPLAVAKKIVSIAKSNAQ